MNIWNRMQIAASRSWNWAVRFGARCIIVVYLLCVLLFTGGLALQSWPDNPLRQRLYVREAERLAILQVTAEGVQAIDRALMIASRLPAPDVASRPNRAELEHLVEQLAFARVLVTNAPELPTNPLHWNRDESNRAARDVLLTAKRCLEGREPQLLPAELEAKHTSILMRTLRPGPGPKFRPSLASSEQARVAGLLADMNNPLTESQESNSEIGKKIRPLLNRLQDTDFILLVIALGAWGAAAQALASVSDYLGHRRYSDSWAVFYLTRPFVGATLAFAFYAILRAGLISRDATWTDINHVGYAAIAVLVGFCSNEALENLKKIAAAVFRDKSAADGLVVSKPRVTLLRWQSTAKGDWLEIIGEGFIPDAQVVVNGTQVQPVEFESDQELVCKAELAALPPAAKLKVVSPQVRGGVSDEARIPPLPTAPAIDDIRWESRNELKIVGRRFGNRFAVLVEGVERTDHVKTVTPTSISLDVSSMALGPAAQVQIVNLTAPAEVSDLKPVPPRPDRV